MSHVARQWIVSAVRRSAVAAVLAWAAGGAFAADSAIESAALDTAPAPPPVAAPFELLGKSVQPGTTDLLYWTPDVSFDGNSIPRGVLVNHGVHPGPTLCLTGVVHGDEHNGLEVVRRVIYSVDPEQLSGTLIGVPIVNLDGFRRGSRYLPDRRDLNRYFPGRPRGSAASRLAYSLFENVVRRCTYMVDVHTGSFHRTNLPQLRGDLTNLDVVDFSRRFGATVILHNRGAIGTLRRAATDAGIPTITLETGEPLRIQDREIRQGVSAIQTAMGGLAMYPSALHWAAQAPVYFESRWVRVNAGGVLISGVRLGDVVEEGTRLGMVVDPVTNRTSEIVAPYSGRVLGMALNQVVLPGYAAFHIGIASTMEEAKAADALEPAIPTDTSGPLEDELSEAQPPADSPDRELEISE